MIVVPNIMAYSNILNPNVGQNGYCNKLEMSENLVTSYKE